MNRTSTIPVCKTGAIPLRRSGRNARDQVRTGDADLEDRSDSSFTTLARKRSPRRGSNPSPQIYKICARPFELLGRLVTPAGLEPAASCFVDRRSRFRLSYGALIQRATGERVEL